MTAQQPDGGRGAWPNSDEASPTSTTSATSVQLVFWAGAKAIAGKTSESWSVETVGAALRAAAQARRDPRFDRLLEVCSVLIDGVVLHPDQVERPVVGQVRAEILPPFAGGAPDGWNTVG
ncbi:MAG: hypothetical protein L0H24_10970, partial [Microlunatus sp.]|nr:hypothetical protein [Microlunatus sp.]